MTGTTTPPTSLARLQSEWEDRELMHAILRAQFANGAAVRVGAVFERHVLTRVAEEVARRIVNIPQGRVFAEHRRARFLTDAVRQIVRTGSRKARTALLAEARDLASTETRFLARVGRDMLGAQVSTPAPSLVEAAITRSPMLGRQFGEWFEDWIPRQTEARVVARVQAGMVAGESTPQILRGLQGTKAAGFSNGELAKSRHALTMLTRTTATHTSAMARDLTFRENATVVPRVRWISTLDLRTTPLCAALDGRTWRTDEPHPNPPAHPNCRSSLIPAIGRRIGKRAALGGRVDARTDYAEWLRGRSVDDQNLVLGVTKAQAWRDGRLSIDDMIDASMTRTLTLAELQAAGKL